MEEQQTSRSSEERRQRRRPAWLLGLAALIALAAGGAYLWQWQQGLRGVDLLGFTSTWVAIPLAAALILMFFYFSRPATRK